MIDVPPELTAFLQQEFDLCIDQVLEQQREEALDRYNGEPYGDEEDGYSQVVAKDTAETIDYMVISILRTLVSGQHIIEFRSRNTEAAREATETLMHLFMDEQDGYMILHDWLKAGLLEKNAVAMTYQEEQPKKRVEGKLPAILVDPSVHKEAEDTGEIDPITGTPIFNVVQMMEQEPKFCDAAVPNEEFYCSPDARNITEAAIKGRKVRKTLSDLIEEGYDPDEVNAIPSISITGNILANERDNNRLIGQDVRTGGSRQVWWFEEYVRFDLNGDGISELLYIQRTEDYKIFAIAEMENADDHPFEDWCPFPMQHRRIGESLADKVMDIERIKTVVLRQTLNGFYAGNNPSTYVHEDSIGENTIDDLLTVRPGRIVRFKGNSPPVERQGSFSPADGLSMIEYVERARETRTGITRLNQGLDEDTLNDTAQGQAQLIARGEQVEEYVARNFANAVAKLLTKKARLLQRYGKPLVVPIGGQYQQVDPSQWPEDMIARARVGLGVANKAQRLMALNQILGMQANAMMQGLSIADEGCIYNTAESIVTESGLGDAAQFFNKPPPPQIDPQTGQPVPAQPKPSPEMAKIQGQLQIAAANQQANQQKAQAQQQMQAQQAAFKAQMDQAVAGHKADLEAATQQHKAMMAEVQTKAQADLAQQKTLIEAQLAQHKILLEAGLAAHNNELQAEVGKHRNELQASLQDENLPTNRPGGDLSK